MGITKARHKFSTLLSTSLGVDISKKTISFESMRLPPVICHSNAHDDIIVNLQVIYDAPGRTDKEQLHNRG